MNRSVLWTVLVAALALNACASLGAQKRELRSLMTSPPLDPTKSCASWRWIGISSGDDGKCPEIEGWTEQPLFPRLSRGNCSSGRVPDREVYEALERFCVYKPADPRKKLPEMPRTLVGTGLVRLDQDCAAISPAAAPGQLERDTWRLMEAQFLEEVGWNEAIALPAEGGPRVRLAFLDTQPTGTGAPTNRGRSLHGFAMAHLADRLLCEPGQACAVKITTQLAMPIEQFHAKDPEKTVRNHTEGGRWGMQTDLATAIEQEVDSWLDEDPDLRLVLNLSLAWDPDSFGGLEAWVPEMNAGTQAVYWALQYARGHGALVVAAAGNHRNGPVQTTGPFLPAAWESERPKFAGCGEDTHGPLLYAVAGVQASGEPLANARKGGIPPRVAYADHVAVACHGASKPIGTYTGSSVAAAVVSSIAAAVWARDPNLEASKVMKHLEDTGEPLERVADFGDGVSTTAGSRRVQQVSLCRALGVAECTMNPDERVRPKLEYRELVQPSGLRLLERPFPWPCRTTWLYQADGGGPLLCPADQLNDRPSELQVCPEPEDNPCPNCLVSPGSEGRPTLYVELADEWSEDPCPVLVSLTVKTDTDLVVVRPIVGPFDCEGPYEVKLPADLPRLDRWRAASLTWTVTVDGAGTLSKESPVLIARPPS